MLPKEDRKFVCRENFALYMVYYFPHYIQTQFAPYHYEMVEDWHDLIDGKITELAWIMYRESAKTSFAKMGFCYLICYGIGNRFHTVKIDNNNLSSAIDYLYAFILVAIS